MTEEENREMLDEAFSGAQLAYVKGKVETALRKNGKATPRSEVSGGYDYSSIYVGVFDSVVRFLHRVDPTVAVKRIPVVVIQKGEDRVTYL